MSKFIPIVIIESPFAGDVERNLRYVRAAMRHSLMLGEAPYASHALYTQEGVLDDTDPDEREQGIKAGFTFRQIADFTAVYTDLGMSSGMQLGIDDAEKRGSKIVYRSLPEWSGKESREDQAEILEHADGVSELDTERQ